MTERDEFKQEFEKKWTKQQWKLAAGTMGAFSLIDVLSYLGPSHLGAGGIVAGLITAAIVGDQGEKMANGVRDALPDFLIEKIRGLADHQVENPQSTRLLSEVQQVSSDVDLDFGGREDFTRFQKSGNYILMSEVLQFFVPSVNQIFLARTEDNKDLYCPARSLCHVALAGSTGNGKSSLIRMLMLQLCKARLQVLLLNPHYTDYDLESYGPDGKPCPEDWTPFKPYLLDDPIKCVASKDDPNVGYPVIAHYLKQAACDIVPRRLERRAKGIPVGKPYFIIIDELPAIVKNVKEAPEWMGTILREGRKVGVFLISAAQNFLVKTVSPDEGGADRDNYRTAYYTGGDATTAKNLLDMPAKEIKEDELGKGVAMLRSAVCKKAIKVFIPYVDNGALYQILGPSTYKSFVVTASVDLSQYEEFRPKVYEQTAQLSLSSSSQIAHQSYAQPEGFAISEIEKMKTVKQPVEPSETSVKVTEKDESFTSSHGDEITILMAVIDLQMAGQKVTREAIKAKLGWNNAKHPAIKAVCDKHHIAER